MGHFEFKIKHFSKTLLILCVCIKCAVWIYVNKTAICDDTFMLTLTVYTTFEKQYFDIASIIQVRYLDNESIDTDH
jgi:hypothetical protein